MPEHAGLHDVALFHRGDLVAPLARQLEGDAGDALDLVGVVDLGIDGALLAVAEIGDGLRLAEIDAAGQLAHDHDVEPLDHLALEARGFRERRIADRRPRHHPPEAEVHRRGRLHRLPTLRDGLQRGGARRVQRRHGVAAAAHIAFPQAVPKKAVIERAGVSPCTYECPAGIKAHGYVARALRSGEHDEAFDLVLETTPRWAAPGACYAPCEDECTRGEIKVPLPIRRLERFIADPGATVRRAQSH